MSGMHRLHMTFFVRGARPESAGDRWGTEWLVSVFESDATTSVGRMFVFESEDKVLEMAKRGRAFKTLADHQAYALAVEKGRGGLTLSLTEEEYQKLRATSRRGSM